MTITTEKAEECARCQDAIKETNAFPGYRSIACRAATTIRSLAAERDALKAENANLQDDLASAERERAHQHGRADRNAAEYAREQKKREQLQAENARLREALRFYAGDEPWKLNSEDFGNKARAALGETQ